jgi:hypothetical protein
MLIRRSGAATPRPWLLRCASLGLLSTLLTVFTGFTLQGEGAPQEGQHPILPRRQIVVLLDVNPNQKNVLPIEQTLAEGVVKKLGQPGNVFSVILFGTESPTALKSKVPADEAIATLRDVGLGRSVQQYLSVQFYAALSRAFDEFTDDTSPKSLLIITEGNDYPHSKAFNHAVARARQLQVTCNVAMVAEHTFYGSKSIQRYGSYLRRLAGTTHGRYVEVGRGQKRVSSSIGRLSDAMLSESPR